MVRLLIQCETFEPRVTLFRYTDSVTNF